MLKVKQNIKQKVNEKVKVSLLKIKCEKSKARLKLQELRKYYKFEKVKAILS